MQNVIRAGKKDINYNWNSLLFFFRCTLTYKNCIRAISTPLMEPKELTGLPIDLDSLKVQFCGKIYIV